MLINVKEKNVIRNFKGLFTFDRNLDSCINVLDLSSFQETLWRIGTTRPFGRKIV